MLYAVWVNYGTAELNVDAEAYGHHTLDFAAKTILASSDRNTHSESRAAPSGDHTATKSYCPSVRLNEFPRYREAESITALFLRCEKRLEDVRQVLFRDSVAIVRD